MKLVLATAFVLAVALVPTRSAALSPVIPNALARAEDDAERAATLAATSAALEELAKDCHRAKNYGARDIAYARLLILDPDHKKARQTLRYLKVRGEGWVQSDQYRPPKDRDEDALAEFPAKLEEAVRPYAALVLGELIRGRESLVLAKATYLASELDALLAADSPLRIELREVWDADGGRYRTAASAESTQESDAAPLEGEPAAATFELEGSDLTLDVAGLGVALVEVPELGQREARWRGRLGECELEMSVYVIEAGEAGMWFPAESEDVCEAMFRRIGRRVDDEWPGFYYDTMEDVTGSISASSYGSLMRGELRARGSEDEAPPGEGFVLGGCLASREGYAVAIQCVPRPDEMGARQILAYLRECASYSGPRRDPQWTEEEAWARWREFAPDSAIDDMEEIVRTEHFIILGNSDSGKLFAKKMEECYETVREIFPFEDKPGQRLLPVFLFRTRDQYNRYYAKISGVDVTQAARSGGHAWRDYYASWYEAPQDPVHIHEVTHQVFGNRLRLSGAGSWFQEGVAEYVETRPNQRGNAARDVKKERHMPLEQFVTIPSLLRSTSDGVKGGNPVGDLYKTAALLIEFLRESKWGRDNFLDFVHRVGKVPRGDRKRIEAVVREVYGTDLAGLEEAWVEYCKKR